MAINHDVLQGLLIHSNRCGITEKDLAGWIWWVATRGLRVTVGVNILDVGDEGTLMYMRKPDSAGWCSECWNVVYQRSHCSFSCTNTSVVWCFLLHVYLPFHMCTRECSLTFVSELNLHWVSLSAFYHFGQCFGYIFCSCWKLNEQYEPWSLQFMVVK